MFQSSIYTGTKVTFDWFTGLQPQSNILGMDSILLQYSAIAWTLRCSFRRCVWSENIHPPIKTCLYVFLIGWDGVLWCWNCAFFQLQAHLIKVWVIYITFIDLFIHSLCMEQQKRWWTVMAQTVCSLLLQSEVHPCIKDKTPIAPPSGDSFSPLVYPCWTNNDCWMGLISYNNIEHQHMYMAFLW